MTFHSHVENHVIVLKAVSRSLSLELYLGQKVSTKLRKTVPLSKVNRKWKAVRELAKCPRD